ncbi:cAMP-binding protein [Leptospira ryugenii]|uniref:cAMP-binding protein n=1 Tax=Leptospira ryugenii TaxID=1917863 RepID=A0A2P2DY85_9LEPT|nr:cyclic nucleotide-binding domain-containing protein [Leptospira ryugenii]GBF49560.1 cAMP-binding protein [Leptospira ryugenii]
MNDTIKINQYPKGAAIVVQNAVNPGLFFIVKNGRVSVDSEHIQIDHDLRYYEPGDSFGLVSALTEHRYLVTLFADTEVELLQIPIRMLGSYLKEHKDLALKILKLYSQELRALQKNLSKANLPADRSNHPEKLIQNAKIYLEWQKPKLASHSLFRFLDWAKQNPQPSFQKEAEDLLKTIPNPERPLRWTSQKMDLAQGEVIFLQDEMDQDIFVVLKGNVKLFSIVRGIEYVIDSLSAGEIFGEMSLIESAPRMASAITDTDCTILRVTPETIFESVGESLLQKIFESIARRIWFSHQRLIILRMESPTIRLYAMVFKMIRDQEIRKGLNSLTNAEASFTIPLSLKELCNMCGLLKIKSETIREFLSDTNLKIEANQITVKHKKRIEEKLGAHKSRSGNLIAKII